MRSLPALVARAPGFLKFRVWVSGFTGFGVQSSTVHAASCFGFRSMSYM